VALEFVRRVGYGVSSISRQRRLDCGDASVKFLKYLFFAAMALIIWIVLVFSLKFLERATDAFPSFGHDLILEQLKNRSLTEALNDIKSLPSLIPLSDTCKPPGDDCTCWVGIDPSGDYDLDKDVGGWHRPISRFMSSPPLPGKEIDFKFVAVRRIRANVFSILACPIDWTALRP
jgi:hypothetical protein